MRGTRDGADRAVGSAWALRYCTAAVDVALALARWLIGAGVLVKIPQMVGRSAGIPPAFFSARKESRWSRKETLRGAVVGIASSGTARLRAVPGAYPSTCGVTCTSGASAPPYCGVRETQLGWYLSAARGGCEIWGLARISVRKSPWDGARYHIGCHYEERSDEIIPR